MWLLFQRLYGDLLPLMEGWTGISLEPTACYGVRIYERGSVLANHVDRVDTHVISAIINVAQVTRASITTKHSVLVTVLRNGTFFGLKRAALFLVFLNAIE